MATAFPFGMHSKSQSLPAGCQIFTGTKRATLGSDVAFQDSPALNNFDHRSLQFTLNQYKTNASLHRADGVSKVAGVSGTGAESTDIVSGIVHDASSMFLAGVFFGYTDDSGVPEHLDFDGRNDLQFVKPDIGQSFFIGDGRTLRGVKLQKFHVPNDAAGLYPGFVDSYDQASSRRFQLSSPPIEGDRGAAFGLAGLNDGPTGRGKSFESLSPPLGKGGVWGIGSCFFPKRENESATLRPLSTWEDKTGTLLRPSP